MLLWRFRCYVSADGTDEIRKWFENQSKQAQARFVSKLSTLARLPFVQWREPLYKNLHNECIGLGEIRFKADKVQQRPLGFRSGEHEFTLLLCAMEKSNRFVPRNACEIALGRKQEALDSRERTNELWLALE